jgi:hypothetical protein
MIIHNLNLENITVAPNETNTKLIVNPNAVLTLSIPLQNLKVIAWKDRKIAQLIGRMQVHQFSLGNPCNLRKSGAASAL